MRILDLAKRMIRLSGYSVGTDIDIEFTGARPGEKIDEELYTLADDLLTTDHQAIWRIVPQNLSQEVLAGGLLELEVALAKRDADAARSLMFTMSSIPRAQIAV